MKRTTRGGGRTQGWLNAKGDGAWGCERAGWGDRDGLCGCVTGGERVAGNKGARNDREEEARLRRGASCIREGTKTAANARKEPH